MNATLQSGHALRRSVRLQFVPDLVHAVYTGNTLEQAFKLVFENWPAKCHHSVVCGNVERRRVRHDSSNLRPDSRNQYLIVWSFSGKQMLYGCPNTLRPVLQVAGCYGDGSLDLMSRVSQLVSHQSASPPS